MQQSHNLLYLGSDGHAGGWLYNSEQQQLSHASLINQAWLSLLTTPDLQNKNTNWQTSRTLFQGEAVSNVIRRDDGRVWVTNKDGLIFLVDILEEDLGQGPLLLGVNANWHRLHQATLNKDLEQLALRYASSEKIYVMNQDSDDSHPLWSTQTAQFV